MSDHPADSPFLEAAPYYEFRAPYAPQALAYVRDTFQLERNSRVLDLGCGPGTIAIPLSRMVGHVLAVDPSEAMIHHGQMRGMVAGCGNINWLCARGEDVTKALGTFNIVTMGQSFHWMDRDVVLPRLAPMIAEGGGLVRINPGRRRPQESWETLANEVIAHYLGHRPRPQDESGTGKRARAPALRRILALYRPRIHIRIRTRCAIDYWAGLLDVCVAEIRVWRSRRHLRRRSHEDSAARKSVGCV